MLFISHNLSIPGNEIEMQAIRSQGAGGQNVNKVSSAIHLRFNIKASSLPDIYKQTLLNKADHRINKDGVINIKAQEFRTQEKNRQAALQRLATMIRQAGITQKPRRPTKPSRASIQKRLKQKNHQSLKKNLRGKIRFQEN